MRKRERIAEARLKAMAEHSSRRRIANDFSRFVRRRRRGSAPIFEREERGECFRCGRRGRLFVFCRHEPIVANQPMGWIRASDPMCAVCAIIELRESAHA